MVKNLDEMDATGFSFPFPFPLALPSLPSLPFGTPLDQT